MNKVLDKIEYANTLGYAVKIKNDFLQKRITCIYNKDNTNYSSVVPKDHFTEERFCEIIDFNIQQHKNKKEK